MHLERGKMRTETPKKPLSDPTIKLFFVASQIPCLARFMGIEPKEEGGLHLFTMPRPWLVPHELRSNELTFDPDKFAEKLGKCSSGEHHCILFILNVWNPGYAKHQGWQFDLFKAFDSLDYENLEGMAQFLKRPIWP